jgi:hypothetical protein
LPAFRPRSIEDHGRRLSDTVTANLEYAAPVVGSPDATPDQLDDLRRKAGIASSAAETTRHRMILEGRRKRARLDDMAKLLEALRALAGAATVKSLCVRRRDQSLEVYLDQLSDGLALAIRQRRVLQYCLLRRPLRMTSTSRRSPSSQPRRPSLRALREEAGANRSSDQARRRFCQ